MVSVGAPSLHPFPILYSRWLWKLAYPHMGMHCLNLNTSDIMLLSEDPGESYEFVDRLGELSYTWNVLHHARV